MAAWPSARWYVFRPMPGPHALIRAVVSHTHFMQQEHFLLVSGDEVVSTVDEYDQIYSVFREDINYEGGPMLTFASS